MKKTIRWATAAFLMFSLFHFKAFNLNPAINLYSINSKIITVLPQTDNSCEQHCCADNNACLHNHPNELPGSWAENECEEQQPKVLLPSVKCVS